MDEKEKAFMELNKPVAGRERTWDECGIEEKIGRLRRVIHELRWVVDDMLRRTRYFEEHRHDHSGQIVVPLRSKYGEVEARGRDLLA